MVSIWSETEFRGILSHTDVLTVKISGTPLDKSHGPRQQFLGQKHVP
jgi:hypothetical protein